MSIIKRRIIENHQNPTDNSEYAVPLRYTQIGLRPTSHIRGTLYELIIKPR